MLIWFWVRQINIITNWIMMTNTCDIMLNWDFYLNSKNLWLRNNGNIRNYIVLNWRYIMFLNAILCWRLIEMPGAIFGLMYISLLHWAPPVWVFISPTGWTQIRALISKMTMFPAMKTNIFHLTLRDFSLWTFWPKLIHPYLKLPISMRYGIHAEYQMCYQSKFTVVGIMWCIFRFSCDIAATNPWYGFLNLMAADGWWPQWLCTITRFTVVITGICSIDKWHRSLNFINRFKGFRLTSWKANTVFFESATQVCILAIQFICIMLSIPSEFVQK